PAMLGQRRVVAVMPYPREPLEISCPITRPVQIVPETHRHRRKGRRAHQLAARAAYRLAVIIHDVDGHPETAALDLSTMHGQCRAAESETGNDVGAAGDGGEMQIRLDRAISEVEAFGQERRAGGEHRPQCREVNTPCGRVAVLLESREVLGAGAEDADVLILRHSPEHSRVGMEGTAVV